MNLRDALHRIAIYGANEMTRQDAVELVAACLEQLKRDVARLAQFERAVRDGPMGDALFPEQPAKVMPRPEEATGRPTSAAIADGEPSVPGRHSEPQPPREEGDGFPPHNLTPSAQRFAAKQESDAAFRAAWAEKERQGYQYGRDALENVRFGWAIAQEHIHDESVRASLADAVLRAARTWYDDWDRKELNCTSAEELHDAIDAYVAEPKPPREEANAVEDPLDTCRRERERYRVQLGSTRIDLGKEYHKRAALEKESAELRAALGQRFGGAQTAFELVSKERDAARAELRQKDLECLEWVRRHEEQRQRAEKAEADAQQAWTLRTEEQEDRRRAETKLTAAEEVIRAVARQLPFADSGMVLVARSDFPEVDEYLARQA